MAPNALVLQMESPPTEIEELAIRCLELGPDDPAALVDQVCADHPQREIEVRQLLESLERVGLAKEPIGCPDTVGGSTHVHEAMHGTRHFGPYKILKQLGAGGMGQVYLAEQTDLRNRKVALKVLRPELAWSRRSRDRFRREIETLSSLDHPGICPIYEAREIDGTQVLAMRYLAGETLADKIRRERDAQIRPGPGSDAVASTLAMMEKVARALHTAHESGLIHRDVKPANIMLVPDEGPVLLDFGLARPDEVEAKLTMSGDVLGTPAYMSSEQISGQGVDRRSDVYSLGATLYEALTGRTPYVATTREALYQSILNGKLPRASSLNHSISHDVDVALEAALDRDPDRRYQTALDFAEDLCRIREHRTIRARRPSLSVRTLRWVQRNPTASASLLFLAIGLIVTAVLLHQSSHLRGELGHSLARLDAITMAQEAVDLLEKDQQAALVRALGAVQKMDFPETVSALHRIYARSHERLRIRLPGQVQRARYMPGGKSLVVAFYRAEAGGIALKELDLDGRFLRDFVDKSLSNRIPSLVGMAQMGSIRAIKFSPSGARMLTVSRSGDFSVWDLRTGELDRKRSFVAPKGKGSAFMGLLGGDFLDEDHIVTAEGPGFGSLDNRKLLWVRGWHLGSKKPLWEIPFDHDRISAISVSPESLRLGVATESGIYFYQTSRDLRETPTLVRAVPRDSGVTAIAFDSRGELLASADRRGRVELHDGTGHHVRHVARIDGKVYSLTFDPGSQYLLIAGSQQEVQLIHLKSEVRTSFLGHESSVYAATFDPSGDRILVAGGARCHLYDVNVPEVPHLIGHDGYVRHVAFDGSGKRVLTTSEDGTARVFDMSGHEIRLLPHEGSLVTWGAFAADNTISTGTLRMKTTGQSTIHQWSRAGEKSSRSAKPGFGRVIAVHQRKDGLRLVVTARNPHLRHLDGRISRLWGMNLPVSSAFFTPKSNEVIASFYRGAVWRAPLQELWNRRLIVNRPGARLVSAALSPDGRTLLTGHSDSLICMWHADAENPQVTPIRTLPRHKGEVSSLAFSPGGEWFASGSQDRSCILWTQEGRWVTMLQGHEGRVIAVAFSPNGRRLVTASSDRTARVWITDTQELIALARKRLLTEVVIPR